MLDERRLADFQFIYLASQWVGVWVNFYSVILSWGGASPSRWGGALGRGKGPSPDSTPL